MITSFNHNHSNDTIPPIKFTLIEQLHPNRRAKDGKRFGFLSFKDIRDMVDLESSLQLVRVDGKPIFIRLAKFGRLKSNKIATVTDRDRPKVSSLPYLGDFSTSYKYGRWKFC